jgi:hypothetical protein
MGRLLIMNVEKRGTQVMAKFLSFGEGENLCKFIKLYFLEIRRGNGTKLRKTCAASPCASLLCFGSRKTDIG